MIIKQEVTKANSAKMNFDNNKDASKHLNTVTFELSQQPTDFFLQYFTNMPVYISVRVLIEDGNTFKLPDNPSQMSPLSFSIMEDSNRYIARENVFFIFAISFDARKGANYTLTFKDNSQLKELVEITFTTTIPRDTMEKLVQKEEAQPYINDINKLSGVLNSDLSKMRRSNALDYVNARSLVETTKKFSTYQFAEMIAVIIVTVIQLQLIRRLFKTSSIL